MEKEVNYAIAKKDKFNVDKSKEKQAERTYKGINFASNLELRYYKEVIEPQLESGEIINCKLQVKYELLSDFIHNGKKYNGIDYISDFNITYSDFHELVVDTKGFLKPIDIIKHKLLLSKYPEIDFKLIGFSKIDGGWVDLDTIKKGRAKRKKEKNK
jgi:hypothetical protein